MTEGRIHRLANLPGLLPAGLLLLLRLARTN